MLELVSYTATAAQALVIIVCLLIIFGITVALLVHEFLKFRADRRWRNAEEVKKLLRKERLRQTHQAKLARLREKEADAHNDYFFDKIEEIRNEFH